MGIDIKYTGSDGRRHNNLGEMMEAEVGSLLDDVAANVRRAVSAQRCPVHGKTASVAVGRGANGINYSISGCCDALTARAERAAQAAVQ